MLNLTTLVGRWTADQKANGMRQKPTRRRRVGRPAAGVREGEMVKNYPQLSVRIPPDARLKLIALSKVCCIPQWRLVLNAVKFYVRDQSPHVRQLIDRIADERSTRAVRRRSKALPASSAAHQAPPRR